MTPNTKAGIACHGLRWIRANTRAEMTIAQAGFILCRRPLRIIPRHSHSSKNGAKTDTASIVTQNGPSIIEDIIASSFSGIGGMTIFRKSIAKAAASVATDTAMAIDRPEKFPKLLLSIRYPPSKYSFFLLWYAAYSIGGRNISGYETSIP